MKDDCGIFVSVDGPNAVGKTTIVNAVAIHLTRSGLRVHKTKEVTETSLGKFIRDSHREYRGKTLALLVAADRQGHIENDILPALRTHDIVITDRYLDSSLAFQQLDAVELTFVWKINADFPRPDLSIALAAPAAVIEQRIASRRYRDRFEETVSRDEEVRIFQEVATFMESNGFNVRRFANADVTIENAAEKLATDILTLRSKKRRA